MIGKREARRIVNFVKENSDADQVEVSILNHEQALTRFANNYIHQNVSESNSSISIRVVFGKKIGIASTNSLDLKKIRETVAWAEKIAQLQRENKDFVTLPKARQSDYHPSIAISKSTVAFSERDRARAVAAIVDIARREGLDSFGSVSNGSAEICVGNSLGIFAYATCGDVFSNIVMSTGNSTGYAQAGARDVRDVDFKKLAETAAAKAVLSKDPVELGPGRYMTIFEPLAASEFLDYMAYYAFNGKIFHEERSFLTGKLGSKIIDEGITLMDDPFAKNGLAFSFDFEGFPKKRLVLIDKGIAKNIVYDSLAAYKENRKSTGHALNAPNPFGPIPLNLVMKGGEKTVDDYHLEACTFISVGGGFIEGLETVFRQVDLPGFIVFSVHFGQYIGVIEADSYHLIIGFIKVVQSVGQIGYPDHPVSQRFEVLRGFVQSWGELLGFSQAKIQ